MPSLLSARAPDGMIDELASILSDFRPAGFRLAARAAAAADTRDLLGRIEVPTLLLWGEHDARSPLAVGERMRDAIPGARAERDRRTPATSATSSSRTASTPRCSSSAAASPAPKLRQRAPQRPPRRPRHGPRRRARAVRRPAGLDARRSPTWRAAGGRCRACTPRPAGPSLARLDVHRAVAAGDGILDLPEGSPLAGREVLAAHRDRVPPSRAARARIRDPGAEHEPLGHDRVGIRPRLRRVPLHRVRAPGTPRPQGDPRPRALGARGAPGEGRRRRRPRPPTRSASGSTASSAASRSSGS